MPPRKRAEDPEGNLDAFFRGAAAAARASMRDIGKHLEDVDAELEDAILEHDKSHRRLMEVLRDAQQTVQKETGRANQAWRELDQALRSRR